MHNGNPVMLIIIDGLGYAPFITNGAFSSAYMPHLKSWLKHYPHALLNASGTAVGLPEGYMGNSQVGHTTIGAGCIIPEPVTIINNAIEIGVFFTNTQLKAALAAAHTQKKTLHIMGLLSDAGIHALESHMFAYIQAAQQASIDHIVLHPFLDGRDTPPRSAGHYLHLLDKQIQQYSNVHIGSLHGRFYAMDRDHNIDRTNQVVALLTNPEQPNKIWKNWQQALEYYYAQNITDEFIPPTQLQHYQPITPHDLIICTNFRPDRIRQLTQQLIHVLCLPPAQFITPISYAKHIQTTVLFEEITPATTLKHELNRHKKTIFSVAETEKYAHITYFFDGKEEKLFSHETRILIPSLKKETYASSPGMSADKITITLINSLQINPADFYLINYANADMVGHSGNFNATVKALEAIDEYLGMLYKECVELHNGTLLITADHGNAELVVPESNENNKKTYHTKSPVFFICVSNNSNTQTNTTAIHHMDGLYDIAPYILHLFDIPIPESMKR